MPRTDAGWAGEISLDLDMVSAICPDCHILLIEADSPTIDNLGAAVNTAVNLGAKFVSNSYGGPENGSENTYDTSYYNHPGVVITASTGDSGFGISLPASGKGVTAVGGTSLTRDTSARGWSETVWNGAGSGCSGSIAKPTFQATLNTTCPNRAEADVAAIADPQTAAHCPPPAPATTAPPGSARHRASMPSRCAPRPAQRSPPPPIPPLAGREPALIGICSPDARFSRRRAQLVAAAGVAPARFATR